MKKILIVSTLVALALALLAIFLLFKPSAKVVDNNDSLSTVGNSTSDTNANTAPIHGKGSLTSLLALAKNLECTISYIASTSEPAIEGSYFVSDGKMRGDFVIPNEGNDIVSSLIVVNDMLYSWSMIDGQSYGMKMSLAESQKVKNDDNAPDSNEAVPLEADVDYTCKPWLIVDGSIFEPPSDVLFKEYDSAVQRGMEDGMIYSQSSTTQTPCGLCEQVPAGESKDQCKRNFKCSE